MSAGQTVRRIVTADDARGRSHALADGPCTDDLLDAARPGFRSTLIWATDRTPAAPLTRAQVEALPCKIAPPDGGALFRIVTIPPDSGWLAGLGADAPAEFFARAGADGAWCGPGSAHPYMQQTRTLDFCLVLEGEVSLVLDTAEVGLAAGDTVVVRASRHAFSNRSNEWAVLAISSHDAQPPAP